jgi:hypothetical protein
MTTVSELIAFLNTLDPKAVVVTNQMAWDMTELHPLNLDGCEYHHNAYYSEKEMTFYRDYSELEEMKENGVDTDGHRKTPVVELHAIQF